MAAPAADYQASQAALAASLAPQVAVAWSLLDVSQLAATLPDLAAAVTALVHRYGSVMALAAARYYSAVRLDAGVTGRFAPPLADPAGLEQVTQSVKWATRDLWSAQPAVPQARAAVQAVADKLVLDTGRDTVIGAVKSDRKARGWVRVTRPGACSFCLLLATRGAVYKSEQTAGFEAHDHDHCHPEPVFTAWEPSADMRHWQAVYRQAARAGSGKAVRDEFRRLVDAERADQGPARGEGTPHGG